MTKNKPKISPQSKSFIILFVIAIIGVYVCLALMHHASVQHSRNSSAGNGYTTIMYNNPTPTPVPSQVQFSDSTTTVDTSAWKTYTNKTYGFSFLYPPTWRVLAGSNSNGYYVMQVDPGAKYYNIKIYISQSGYYAMDGLPFTAMTIDGKPAQDVEGILYGINDNGTYYTFDQGQSESIKPQFEALVKSTTFTQ